MTCQSVLTLSSASLVEEQRRLRTPKASTP